MTMSETIAVEAYDLLADIYDVAVPDPPGFTAFYLSACVGVGSVLYVGCGTGRLLARLAEACASTGTSIVGVDPSAGMLSKANERIQSLGECLPDLGPVELLVDSLPGLVSQGASRYDRIVVAGGAFEYLMTTSAQIAALQRMRDLLTSVGLVLIDVAAPPFATSEPRGNYLGEDFPAGGREQVVEGVKDDKPVVESSEVQLAYDHFHQVLESRCSFYLQGRYEPVAVTYRTRYTTIAEWRMLLVLAGLRGEVHGGFGREAVSRRSSNFVVEAWRR